MRVMSIRAREVDRFIISVLINEKKSLGFSEISTR